MLLKRKVDIETAKADIEGVNSLHKTAQNLVMSFTKDFTLSIEFKEI